LNKQRTRTFFCLLRDARQAGITAPVLGHVGDGNFRMVLMIDPENAREVQRAKEVNHRLVSRAIVRHL
jgi:D-lactate dehydrogenase (cytochrome)